MQQHGNNYSKWEEGNTLSLDSLRRMLKEKYSKYNVDLEKHVISRMKDLVLDTFFSWKKNLNPNNRKHCFELFGYDFLIDEDIRTWLLEVIDISLGQKSLQSLFFKGQYESLSGHSKQFHQRASSKDVRRHVRNCT